MSRSITRRRHCRHLNFSRLARRSGYGAGLNLAYTGTGNGTLTGVVVRPGAPAETWTITLTAATTFTATGGTSGLQTATGTVGTLYTSDSGEISFLVTAGGTPFESADEFTLDTEVLPGHVLNLNPTDALRYLRDAAQRLNLASDGLEELHGVTCADGASSQTPGPRSNQYTFEDVNAASTPGDVGLT